MSNRDLYSDDPVEFEQQKSKKRVPVVLVLIAALIGGTIYIQTTLAANISLNTGPVEFGQGITQAVACDSNLQLIIGSRYEPLLKPSIDNPSGRWIEGFAPEISIQDVANSCIGSRFVINVYNENSNSPLNLYPIVIDYLPYQGGIFSGLSSATSAYFPYQVIDQVESGIGTAGSASEVGSSSFIAQPFWGEDGAQPDARDIYKATIESINSPSGANNVNIIDFNLAVVSSYENRSILAKVQMNLNLVNFEVIPNNVSHSISPNNQLTGYTFTNSQVPLTLPIDTDLGVTEDSYTLSESGILCNFLSRTSLNALFVCSTETGDWSLGISYAP